MPASPQPKLYKSVIDDVINEVRELFLDEGVDEQVLLELKTVPVSKILLLSYRHCRMNTCFILLFNPVWQWTVIPNQFYQVLPQASINLKKTKAYSSQCFFLKRAFLCSRFSYGKTNSCSQRQWRASIPRNRQSYRPLSSNSRLSKSSRWPSQHRHNKSSCLPSSSSKVSIHLYLPHHGC